MTTWQLPAEFVIGLTVAACIAITAYHESQADRTPQVNSPADYHEMRVEGWF